MRLRAFVPVTDFEKVRNWIFDERSHAMWCANRFSFPLQRDRFMQELSAMMQRTGDTPFVAAADNDHAVGFFCYSINPFSKEGRLKFIVVDPAYRGKGIAAEMLHLAITYAFQETHAETVTLSVFPENVSAKKCYEKVGFAETKTDCRTFSFHEESWDRCTMAIGKNEHEKRELALKAACAEEILKQLKVQHERYPLMKEEDIIKFVFQGMLGVGHLIHHPEEAKERLSAEMDSLEPNASEPLVEKISTDWVRLNLRPAKAIMMSQDDISEHLVRSAERRPLSFKRQDVYHFCIKLDGSDQMKAAAEKVLNESWLPNHSAQYRENYRPAYRVLYQGFTEFGAEEKESGETDPFRLKE